MIKLAFLLVVLSFGVFFALKLKTQNFLPAKPVSLAKTVTPTPSPKASRPQPPPSKILKNDYHIFQTFNNCGPAALSMALSYYGINASQQELGQSLRPYQVAGGDNDDKSTTLEEMAEKSKEYGLIPFHRPNGNIEIMKALITNDMPLITRTWTEPNEDIGHYRIVKGYDQQNLIQDDSLQNKNLSYTYENFNEIWRKFNYEYLVLVPKDKEEIAREILGEDAETKVAWQKAAQNSQAELAKNPSDVTSRFNLSVALYNIGDFQGSTEEFEKVETRLSFRTLWYQIEPIEAYYQLGNYQRVFQLTDKVLDDQNRAFSELYLIRGEIHKKENSLAAARTEFAKALLYNKNLKSAQAAQNSI